jgi:hypothetical protein
MMPQYPKHIVTDHTRPYKEIILQKLGYRRAENSIEAPEFKMEHVAELISRGTIPIDFVREAEGILYLHNDAISILDQAYHALNDDRSPQAGDPDIVSRLEINFNHLVDNQIAQLENSLAIFSERFGTRRKRDDEEIRHYLQLLKDRANLKKLYRR